MPDQPFPRIVELHVSGFQSHRDTRQPLAPVTVLVGKNDQGKSAMIRGLFYALLNKSGGGGDFGFIRDDCTNAVVEITYENGARVIWTKPKRGGASYRIIQQGRVEDIEASRVGKDLPPVLTDITGVQPLIVDGKKYNLQLTDQHTLPFLLSGSGGIAAKLLSRVSRLDIVVSAQIAAKRERDRVAAEAKESKETAAKIAWQLAFAPDYQAMLDRCTALADRQEAVEARRLEMQDVRRSAEQIPVLTGRHDAIVAVTAAWATADAPARVTRLDTKVRALTERREAVRAFREATEAAAAIEPAIDGWRRMAALSERVVAVGNRMENHETLRSAVGAYAAAKRRASADLDNATAASGALEHAEAELVAALGGLTVCPVCLRPMKEGTA